MYNILDNFVNEKDLKNFFDDYCLNGKIGWAYNNRANHHYPIDSFSSNKNTNELLQIPFIENCLNRINPIVKKFNNVIDRIFINGMPSGSDGFEHTDREGLTALLMINPVWKKEWGGEFLYYDKNYEIFNASSFKPGRLIIFDGNNPHRGLGPNKFFDILRVTIAFQCLKIND